MTRHKRTNEEILGSLTCNLNEAAQVLDVSWESLKPLIDDKKIRTVPIGKRERVSVESLKAFARGDEQEAPAT